MIEPHGGILVSRVVDGSRRDELAAQASGLPRVTLNSRELSDLEMIATGGLSPLEGFMDGRTYESVVDTMRLPDGLPWSIPVTLAVDKGVADECAVGERVALHDTDGRLAAVLDLEDKYVPDKEQEAREVLRTTDSAHPGVEYLQSVGEVYLGGRVHVIELPRHEQFAEYYLEPRKLRALFDENGWRTVVAFQTRNPIHRAHEYLQKCALEMFDALLVHPLMGATKKGDIPADVRMQCYLRLLENYYPKDRVVLSIFPAAMRYAGPREAIFHAIARKNYGCTHLIVGRDHAGVGDYYGTYDAQRVFDEFDDGELGIRPVCFEHAFYCRRCGGMASAKTCPHPAEDHMFLSGTQVREMVARGEVPPPEFTRAEVAQTLIENARKE